MDLSSGTQRLGQTAPIQSLSERLFRESLLEIAALLSVSIFALWYFVFRLGQVRVSRGGYHSGAADSLSAVTESKRL